jgi:serine/threonine-protein kinase
VTDSLNRTQPDPNQARARSPNDVPADLRQLGEYRILRRLGEGGMGAVYLGYHEAKGDQVALKVLSEGLASNQAYVDRFYREAKSGALLNHPSIVRSFGARQDPGTLKHYLVLEFVDGTSAQALMEQFGHLSVGDAVHITLDVAKALEHAHSRNIIHRDIKPDNILITRAGVSKLVDFGLAKRTDETSHLTDARQGFGTPFYMPYEQAMNARHADGRSDIYALGATLYHLLTGEVPFKGENPLEIVEAKDRGDFLPASKLNPAVPRVLDQILSRMLARQPRDRYQTASELIVDLERSRLTAVVPSYADAELALKDPWMRACIASSAQPTQPDLAQLELAQGRMQTPAPEETGEETSSWVVRYLGRDSRWRRVRLTSDQVLQRLRDGRLPPEAEACGRQRDGFRPLKEITAFAGALKHHPRHRQRAQKKQESLPPAQMWGVVFIAGLTALLVSALVLVYLIFLRNG